MNSIGHGSIAFLDAALLARVQFQSANWDDK
jgi:hypothetical protein